MSMKTDYPVVVTTFYKFSPLSEEQLNEWEGQFHAFAERSDLLGLIISAAEGLNSTVAGSNETILQLKDLIRSIPGFADTIFKDSRAKRNPFKRFKIKRRDEIVTLKRPEFVPDSPRNNHLSPEEWQRVLEEESDYVLIDTRNGYEVELGKFEGAIDPEIHMFSEFGDFIERSGIPTDKKVLMYCTGGIRCEKAIFEMQSRGYQNVFQLEGGILNYLKEFPNSKFEGECFVFDHRVAVDQELLPSETFRLCPHCGDPGSLKIVCGVCDSEAIVCSECNNLPYGKTCSKNCAYHSQVCNAA
ncbi:MAG: hypothetical protein KDD70_16715 [Bdellovibrionales bacterium]|nr:hypothetical protein [Bdellovibrionales bacterium]